jgi:hypothetical protein
MAVLKAYTVGNNGFVCRAVLDTLGEPAHRRQARVILVAASKAAAVRLGETVGFRVSPNDVDFRVAGGPLADSILAATPGPAVYAMALDARSGDPVVRLNGGAGILVGALAREGSGYVLGLGGGA